MRKRAKFREKMDMYDMILASAFDKGSIVIPDDELDSRSLAVGFSCIASKKYVSKYYMIAGFPDFVKTQLYSEIRNDCSRQGVLIDFFTYSEPYKIDWTSPEMTSKMRVWKDYCKEHNEEVDVFKYRDEKSNQDNRKRIILSTGYLNRAELDNGRTLAKTYIIVRVTARRDKESLINMASAIESLRSEQSKLGLKIRELRINMMDWARLLNPFSLMKNDMYAKIPKKVVTDDIEANFCSIRQGKVGKTGVPLGMDIKSGQVVLYKFKEDVESAENTLIAGETGSGKSYFVKPLITYMIAQGTVGVIMDYEGDEYTNLGDYIAASNPDDVCMINIGKSSEYYFDPCPIPAETGEPSIDSSRKQTAMSYIKLMFQTMICDKDGMVLNKQQLKVISIAIQRMYDSVGVTDDSKTWHKRSQRLRIRNVYEEIKMMVENNEFYNPDGGNELHDAATDIVNATSVFFEPGEVYAGTFGIPLSIEKIYRAKLIIFQFGQKGEAASLTEAKIIKLKQIAVAYVNTLVSNYCKYVKKCLNFKIWEEGQRWLHLAGSAEIIINEITGGRKRGDINFIITNNISDLLKEADTLGEALTLNIQNYFIGRIPKKSTREKFCSEFKVTNMLPELDKIADNGKGRESSAYRYAFALVLKNGSTPVVRSELPKAITESKLYANQKK